MRIKQIQHLKHIFIKNKFQNLMDKPKTTIAEERQEITPGDNDDDDLYENPDSESSDQSDQEQETMKEAQEIEDEGKMSETQKGSSIKQAHYQQQQQKRVQIENQLEGRTRKENIENPPIKQKEQTVGQYYSPQLIKRQVPTKADLQAQGLKSQEIEQTQTQTRKFEQKKQKQEQELSKKNIKTNEANQESLIPMSANQPKKATGHELSKIILQEDSKVIYAINCLFKGEVKDLMPFGEGRITCDPKLSQHCITIECYNEVIGQEVANRIQNFIEENIQFVQVDKSVACLGLRYSQKYRKKLQKQKMAILEVMPRKKKELTYYICGKDRPPILSQQASKLKNKKVNFFLFRIYHYSNSRSYKAIMANFFQIPTIRQAICQKFNCKEIQVACTSKFLPIPEDEKRKKGVLCLLTFYEQSKFPQARQVQGYVRDLIEKNYWLFCFTYHRATFFEKRKKWSPKIDGAYFFVIHERKMKIPLSYLFVIIQKGSLNDLKQRVIKEIQIIAKQEISGQRFFLGFQPCLGARPKELKYSKYPAYNPYSQSIWAPKGLKFDWKRGFEI